MVDNTPDARIMAKNKSTHRTKRGRPKGSKNKPVGRAERYCHLNPMGTGRCIFRKDGVRENDPECNYVDGRCIPAGRAARRHSPPRPTVNNFASLDMNPSMDGERERALDLPPKRGRPKGSKNKPKGPPLTKILSKRKSHKSKSKAAANPESDPDAETYPDLSSRMPLRGQEDAMSTSPLVNLQWWEQTDARSTSPLVNLQWWKQTVVPPDTPQEPFIYSDSKPQTKILSKRKSQDEDGDTALHRAIRADDYEMVDRLLHQRPDIYITNKAGDTAWALAIRQKNYDIIELFDRFSPRERESESHKSKSKAAEGTRVRRTPTPDVKQCAADTNLVINENDKNTMSPFKNIVFFGHGGIQGDSTIICPKNIQVIIPGLITFCNDDLNLLKYWLYLKNQIETDTLSIFDDNFYWRLIRSYNLGNKIYTEGMPIPNMNLSVCPYYCRKYRTKAGLYENKTDDTKLPGLCFKKYEEGYDDAQHAAIKPVLTNRGLFKGCDSELIAIDGDFTHTVSSRDETLSVCKRLELRPSDARYKQSITLGNLINDLSRKYSDRNIRLVVLSCTKGSHRLQSAELAELNKCRPISNMEFDAYTESVTQNIYPEGEFVDPTCSTKHRPVAQSFASQLEKLGIGGHHETLAENGLETVADLRMLTVGDMDALGFSTAERARVADWVSGVQQIEQTLAFMRENQMPEQTIQAMVSSLAQLKAKLDAQRMREQRADEAEMFRDDDSDMDGYKV